MWSVRWPQYYLPPASAPAAQVRQGQWVTGSQIQPFLETRPITNNLPSPSTYLPTLC